MKKGRRNDPDMREEYDPSAGVRGKYARRYAEGSNVVVLDPDVAAVFSDAESVNGTLRAVARIIDEQSRKSHGAKANQRMQQTRKARG
ncbi:MAG: hypothetical protein ACE5NW_18730 [Acidiferrobacterales bacterium]